MIAGIIIPLFPLMLFILTVLLVTRLAKKNVKSAQEKMPQEVSGPSVSKSTSSPRQIQDSSGLDRHLQMEFSHLNLAEASPQGASSSGSLPEAPLMGEETGEMSPRAGSLAYHSTEGTDPCHDDYSSLSSGSLDYTSSEGEDPCHEDWTPVAAEETSSPEPAALRLNWTGDEMVKGFVYGEILRRKAG